MFNTDVVISEVKTSLEDVAYYGVKECSDGGCK